MLEIERGAILMRRAPLSSEITVSTYYGNVNPELLRWTPLDAHRVLELGCGEGAFAAAYKARNPGARYVGVEPHPSAASLARGRMDQVLQADFMQMSEFDLAALGRFEVIVLGDVLEHQGDPWLALLRIKGLLQTGGTLCLSVPNVSHWTGLANLMSGAWPAEPSGLFDRTHLRFFTMRSLTDTLAESGFTVDRALPRRVLGERETAERWITLLAKTAAEAGLDRAAFIDRAQTLQYVVTARAKERPAPSHLHVHLSAFAPDFLEARTRLPLEALQSQPGVTVSYREKSSALPALPPEAAKVLILQRIVAQEGPGWAQYLREARAGGWMVVFEIDDHPGLIGRVQRRPEVAEGLERAARSCHAVQTSTGRLAAALRSLNPEVAVFPNALLDLPPLKPRPGVRRVFYGALNREGFSRQVAAALAPTIEAHPHLEFVVVHDQAFFQSLPTDHKTFRPALPYADYLAEMSASDVVLSPLEGREAETYKSDIKWLEAGRAGAVMIASPCVYAETIRHGETGFIAPDLEAWPQMLSRLATEPELRNKVAQAAWAQLRDSRMLAGQVAERLRWYRSLVERKDQLNASLLARCPELVGPADPAPRP